MQVEALAARQGVPGDSPCSDAPVKRPGPRLVPQPAFARTSWSSLSAPRPAGDHGGVARLHPQGRAQLQFAAASEVSGLTATVIRNHPKSIEGVARTSNLLTSFAVTASRHRALSRTNPDASLRTNAAPSLAGTSSRWTCCVGECGSDIDELSRRTPSLSRTAGILL